VNIPINRLGGAPALRLLYGGLVLGAVATVAACGSSSSGTAAAPASSKPAGAPSSASAAGTPAVTISAKNVAGVGTVLVNGKGQTLYMLTSEKGGKITCTDDNGCTKLWPDTELPKGVTAATAGSGIQASLLGTVKGADGSLYVTYHDWPLYTYAGDNGPGQTHGQGLNGFGGTWYVLSASGNPVTSSHAQSGGSGYTSQSRTSGSTSTGSGPAGSGSGSTGSGSGGSGW
jgi:predicted lipoprotein with Yx(FWY)xxD motif